MSAPPPEGRRCPVCGKATDQRSRPFCSKRCADIDLAHWLKGDYAIAVRETPEGEEERGADEDDGAL